MKALLILLASLFITASLSLSAKTIKFPEKDPSFSIALPDDWTAKPEKNGYLDCEAGDGSNFTISFCRTAARTDAQAKTVLLKMLKLVCDSLKIQDSKTGEIREIRTAKNVKLFALGAHGSDAQGPTTTVSLSAFTPKEGTYFIVLVQAPADILKAHEKAMAEIVNSLTPIL